MKTYIGVDGLRKLMLEHPEYQDSRQELNDEGMVRVTIWRRNHEVTSIELDRTFAEAKATKWRTWKDFPEHMLRVAA